MKKQLMSPAPEIPATPTEPDAAPKVPRVQPRTRGVSHRDAFFVALLPCSILVW